MTFIDDKKLLKDGKKFENLKFKIRKEINID